MDINYLKGPICVITNPEHYYWMVIYIIVIIPIYHIILYELYYCKIVVNVQFGCKNLFDHIIYLSSHTTF